MPVMVSAATMALMMASSVACTVAAKSGSIFSLGKHFQIHDVIGERRSRIGGGEGDEDVAGAVAGDAAVAAQAQGDAAGNALQLVREERRVGGDDHDDGAAIRFTERGAGVGALVGNFLAHRNAGDAQIRRVP